MRDVEALTGPPSATVRPDVRPAGMGACTCPPGTLYAGCECAWGTLVDRMLMLGYGRQADPVTIAREVTDLGAYARQLAGQARQRALTALGRTWEGSAAALARLVGISSQALRAAAPQVFRSITDRQGTTGITVRK